MLCRLGLQLAGWRKIRNKGDVDEEDVLSPHVVPCLTCSFKEWLRFDVTDSSTDLRNNDIGANAIFIRTVHRQNTMLDFIRNVGNNLHGIPEVFPTALLGNDLGIDLTSSHIRVPRQVAV